MTWIYAFPAWAVAIGAMVSLGAVSAGMTLAAHRFIAPGTLRANDVAGPMAGVVGTLLAVLLSFILVTVWQEYDQAAQSSFVEASAVAGLGRIARLLPPAVRRTLRPALRRYATIVVREEWPLMRLGDESPVAAQAARRLLAIVVGFEPKTAAAQALQTQAIAYEVTLENARRDRLFDNQQGIPLVLYAGIFAIAIVTLALCSLFSIESLTTHVVLNVGVAAAIAIVLVLTAEFDYPFRGDTQIPPAAWQGVLGVLNRP